MILGTRAAQKQPQEHLPYTAIEIVDFGARQVDRSSLRCTLVTLLASISESKDLESLPRPVDFNPVLRQNSGWLWNQGAGASASDRGQPAAHAG